MQRQEGAGVKFSNHKVEHGLQHDVRGNGGCATREAGRGEAEGAVSGVVCGEVDSGGVDGDVDASFGDETAIVSEWFASQLQGGLEGFFWRRVGLRGVR